TQIFEGQNACTNCLKEGSCRTSISARKKTDSTRSKRPPQCERRKRWQTRDGHRARQERAFVKLPNATRLRIDPALSIARRNDPTTKYDVSAVREESGPAHTEHHRKEIFI